MISSKALELGDFSFHLLVNEFRVTGVTLRVAQGQSYYDLEATKLLEGEFSKTLLVIGFPIGTL